MWKKNTKSYGNDGVLAKKLLPTYLGKLLFKNPFLDLNTGMFYKEFQSDFVFWNIYQSSTKHFLMKI